MISAPAEMGEAESRCFLFSLATERRVSVSTPNQALNALLFLYREILKDKQRLRRRHCAGEKTSPPICRIDTLRGPIYRLDGADFG